MAEFFAFLAGLSVYVAIGCQIYTGIKMIRGNEIALGAAAVVCGCVGFFFGWSNVKEFNLGMVMRVWTLSLVVYGVCFGIALALGFQIPE
jgi:hypothetical protein